MHRQEKRRFEQVLVAMAIGCAVATGASAQPQSKPAGAPALARLPVVPKAGTYKIDVAHSHAYFFVSHLGISRFMGRFDDIQGDYVVGDRPEKSSVKASIRVDSVNTKHQKLEEHLRSPDFFDAARFPSMEFASSKVSWNNRGEGVLSGHLTIHGVTRPVNFALKVSGAGTGLRGETRSGFEAKTSIKRSDYGMQYGLPTVVGNEVRSSSALSASSRCWFDASLLS